MKKLAAVVACLFLVSFITAPSEAALARTQRISSATFAPTASFTPSNNSLLVVVCMAVGNSDSGMRGTDLSISNTGGWTFTSRKASTGSAGWSYAVRIWTAPVTTGASMTVTCSTGVGSIGGNAYIYVADYTGYDTGTPVGVDGAASIGAGADGAQSFTLSGSPCSGGEVIAALVGAVGSGTVNVTEGSGWTELADAPLLDQSRNQVQIRTGSTSTSVAWVDVAVGGSPSGVGVELVGVEINVSGGCAGGGGTVVNPLGGGGGAAARPVTFLQRDAANDNEFRLRAVR